MMSLKEQPIIVKIFAMAFLFLSLCAIFIYSCNTKSTVQLDKAHIEVSCNRQTGNALQCCIDHSGMNEWACRNKVWGAEKITYKEWLIKEHKNVVGCTLEPGHAGAHNWE